MKQRMIGVNKDGNIGYLENWSFTNLVVDGVIVNWFNYKDYFDLNLVGTNGNNIDQEKSVKNVTFREEGSLYAIFVEEEDHINTYPGGSNGMIHCPQGTDQTVYFIPEEGYRIRDVIIDGESLGRRQMVRFENVQSNHNAEVKFGVGDDYYDLEPLMFRNPTPVKSGEINGDINVWPNPASDLLFVHGQASYGRSARYSLMSIDGRLVSEGILSDDQQGRIGIEEINPGTYLLVLKTGNEQTTIRKILIN